MNQETNNQPASFWEANRLLIKGLFIGFLILLMLIPIAMISGLIHERQFRQEEVVNEISRKWASGQTIQGPIVAIPYVVPAEKNKPAVRKNLYLLPDQLKIDGELMPEVRHRSLYDVTLYRSEVTLTGSFDVAQILKTGVDPSNIQWNEAHLLVGLDDARGLEEEVVLHWGQQAGTVEAGIPGFNMLKSGLSTRVQIAEGAKTSFSIKLKLKGSEHLYFTPLGRTTRVSLKSPWTDPAFDGQYLPTSQAKVNDSGFVANWNILQVSRNYPQAWKDDVIQDLQASAFGVKLLQPTDNYAKTDRSVKYAILIIALTFTIFFFVETFQKRQIHPLQYILVGIALTVFYTLLLSISEYLGYNPAYLIAASATVSLITVYVYGIFKKIAIAAGFAVSLGGLYTYIFILIQLQDYALLFGSVGLFLILAVIMYFSRKIDWYGVSKTATA